jgi:hypothetical protein
VPSEKQHSTERRRCTRSSPHARTLPIAEESVRPMLPALTEARVVASTKAVATGVDVSTAAVGVIHQRDCGEPRARIRAIGIVRRGGVYRRSGRRCLGIGRAPRIALCAVSSLVSARCGSLVQPTSADYGPSIPGGSLGAILPECCVGLVATVTTSPRKLLLPRSLSRVWARRRPHKTSPHDQPGADAEDSRSQPCRRQPAVCCLFLVEQERQAAPAGRWCPWLAQAWVSVSAASIVVAFSGAVRLGGLRSRGCRYSRGHRPSGCGSEARGRRAPLPQRRRRGVGGSLTRTPLRRAYRLQRPCSLPIVRAYFGSA